MPDAAVDAVGSYQHVNGVKSLVPVRSLNPALNLFDAVHSAFQKNLVFVL